jgi:hypothetical protein
VREDFESLEKVLRHNVQADVIDLMPYIMALEDDPYLKALEPAPVGIYLPGNVEPFLKEGERYHYANGEQVKDIKEILKNKKDIFNSEMVRVVSGKDLITKARFFKTEPSLPVTAYKLAVAVVGRYLSNLCRHTSGARNGHNLYKYVKPEFHQLVDNDEYMIAFEKLLDRVMRFVGNDTWNIYFMKTKGASLIIEKGVDWRIYRYYELTLNDEDDEDEIHGT